MDSRPTLPLPRRRFTLIDGMIVIAASAGGLAFVRAYSPGLSPVPSGFRTSQLIEGPLVCLLAAGSLGVLSFRLRRPRPPLRRVMRQPGVVACLAATVALALGLANYGMLLTSQTDFRRWLTAHFWQIIVQGAGPAVVGAWIALALGGRWRAEAGWIDRLGRLLGSSWVLVFLYTAWLQRWLYHLLPSL